MGLAAAGLLTYISISSLFWHFPQIVHKRKRISFKARHISHRGGSAEGYENTLKNFSRALASGTDMLELDVRMTRDRKVVVFHDKDLTRVTGLPHLVSEIDYDNLPRLSTSVAIDSIPGTLFSDTYWSEEDRRIPLLSEVFDAFPMVPINIDLKDNNSPHLIEAVAALIKRYNRQQFTVWGSFNHSNSVKLYETDPSVGLFFSGTRVGLVLLLMIMGLLPFIPLRETHYEVFLPLSLRKRRLTQVASLAVYERLILWICDTFMVWRPLITHLRKRGIQVYLWVANDVDEFEKCLELGADGIMTDYPTKLRHFLDANKPNPQEPTEQELELK